MILRMFFCLLSIVTLITGCEPGTTVKIRNDTSISLDVWLFAANDEHILMNDGDLLGSVEPGSILTKENILAGYPVYLFEGKDQSGNIVYSKYFKKEEMVKARWKIVISF